MPKTASVKQTKTTVSNPWEALQDCWKERAEILEHLQQLDQALVAKLEARAKVKEYITQRRNECSLHLGALVHSTGSFSLLTSDRNVENFLCALVPERMESFLFTQLDQHYEECGRLTR